MYIHTHTYTHRASDVTILGVQQGFMQLLGTAEDFELGGSEVDEALVNFCVNDFKRKNKMDPRESAR